MKQYKKLIKSSFDTIKWKPKKATTYKRCSYSNVI